MAYQQLQSFKILLLGESCIDQYIIGTCDRLSPEAPVPVIKVKTEFSKCGMAHNVFQNLQALNINTDLLTNRVDIYKTRYIDDRSKQQLLRVDKEDEIDNWCGKLPVNLSTYNAIVISDYNKGFLTQEQIVSIRNEFTGPIYLDTKKRNLGLFSGIIIKINEVEYNSATSFPARSNLIVTLGDKGAMRNDIIYAIPKIDLVDVCGCGDTFLAALVFRHLHTKDLDEAIKFANKAASITAQHRGNYCPSLTEIQGVIDV